MIVARQTKNVSLSQFQILHTVKKSAVVSWLRHAKQKMSAYHKFRCCVSIIWAVNICYFVLLHSRFDCDILLWGYEATMSDCVLSYVAARNENVSCRFVIAARRTKKSEYQKWLAFPNECHATVNEQFRHLIGDCGRYSKRWTQLK